MKNGNSDSDETDGESEKNKGADSFGNDLKKNIKSVRFWVEVLALIGLGIYVCETKRTNDLTQQSLSTGEVRFRAQERPWIMASPQASAIEEGRDSRTKQIVRRFVPIKQEGPDTYEIGMTIQIRNSGNSPAVKVLATPSYILVGPSDSVQKNVSAYLPTYPATGGSVIMMNDYNTVATPPRPIITRKQLDLVASGQWEIFIVGGAKYEDTFLPEMPAYETTYCFRYNPEGIPFGNCDIKPIVLR